MASMVGKTCSSSSSQSSPGMIVQEKGSRKRDPNKVVPEPRNDCTTYEIFAEKFDIVQSHAPFNGCETCGVKQDQSEGLKLDLGLSCAVGKSEVGSSNRREEVESYEAFHDADWNDLTEYKNFFYAT